MRHQGARLPFEIADHLFIAHLEHDTLWQHGAPMLHQCLVTALVTSQLGEIVAVRVPCCK
jgi:hypothetical protein